MVEKTEKILVAVDGSANSERALLEAKEFGEVSGGEITILTIVKPLAYTYFGNIELAKIDSENLKNAKEKLLKKSLEEFENYEGVVNTKLRTGSPADEILQEIEENPYDLVVMGSKGLGAFSRAILGSVSNKVLNHAESNILIVK